MWEFEGLKKIEKSSYRKLFLLHSKIRALTIICISDAEMLLPGFHLNVKEKFEFQ